MGGGYVACLLALLLVFNACSDSSLVNEKQQIKQEVSKIDGKPIVNINAADLAESTQLSQLRNTLAANQGPAIVRALNEKARLNTIQQGRSVSMKKLAQFSRAKGNTPDLGSSHIRVTDPDGETEDFVLTLRRYHPNPKKIAAKGSSKKLKSGTTYLALSPDRFYLQDDENGNEQWPVTFPAVALDDSTDKITVTFNKDGFVSSSLSEKVKAKDSAAQPNLVFAEGTPVLKPVDPCIENPASCGGGGGGSGGGGSGGGGNGPYCTEVSGDGGPLGEPDPYEDGHYFTIKSIRLYATGDGDGAAELQMFVKQDDEYDGECFPRSYQYRFDHVRDAWGALDTYQESADGSEYFVQNVQHAGVTYNVSVRNGEAFEYPLFNFTRQPGPWRLVMSDDDKDYNEFSRRRESDFAQDIQTYDVAAGSWSQVKTGFSTDRKTTGSSDDPIRESGVRRITSDNVDSRLDYIAIGEYEFTASKNYTGGRFEYKFSTETYSIPR